VIVIAVRGLKNRLKRLTARVNQLTDTTITNRKEQEMDADVKVITVNGVDYIPQNSVVEKEINSDIKIVVLQRGWIVVGRFERKDTQCKLHNASVIRTWGTTNGLGEIAESGPTSSTKLDKCKGVVEFDYMTVVLTIDCEVRKWQNKL
jgi:hypothetical protein